MSADWDGRAEGLTRVKAFIVRATVHSTSWGRERRREAGAAGEAGTQTQAPGPMLCWLWDVPLLLLLLSHRFMDEETEAGQTLVLASFANIMLGLALSWKRKKSV